MGARDIEAISPLELLKHIKQNTKEIDDIMDEIEKILKEDR